MVKTLIIATRNLHKVHEIQQVLTDSFAFLTLKDFPAAPNVVEDADTFAGNAMKKSLELARWLASHPVELARALPAALKSGPSQPPSSCVALADDSGLEVDAINGAPGVYSARFAALGTEHTGNSTDRENTAKLLQLLAHVPEERRTARFRCVIALTPVILSEDTSETCGVCFSKESEFSSQMFDGVCEGRVVSAPRGTGGFGYDPVFVPNGFLETFAELGDAIKNRISHRAVALEKLRVALAAP